MTTLYARYNKKLAAGGPTWTAADTNSAVGTGAGMAAGLLDATDQGNDLGYQKSGTVIGSSVLKGAASGAALGPWGAAAGAVVGGITGIIKSGQQNKEQTALRSNIKSQAYLRDQSASQAAIATNPELVTGNEHAAFFAANGGKLYKLYKTQTGESAPIPKPRSLTEKAIGGEVGDPTTKMTTIATPAPHGDDFYKANASLLYYKDQLNSKLKDKDPNGYGDYMKGLGAVRKAGGNDNDYIQKSNFNTYLTPDEVKSTLGDKYDNYMSTLKTVTQGNLAGTIEGEKPADSLNYGRRFASLSVTPSVNISQGGRKYARDYQYNPTTSAVDIKEDGDLSLRPAVFQPQTVAKKAMGGPLQQKFDDDNIALQQAQGGNAQPMSAGTAEIQGPSHANGGVDLPQSGANVEGGETTSGNFVFSKELGFAQLHKPIAKALGKIEAKPQSRERVNAINLLKQREQRLAQEQELYKKMHGIQ